MDSDNATTNRPIGRVPELDLLRFVAAASVVLYHYTYRPRLNGVIDEQAFGVVPLATRFGYLGVTLFFMISGFVILWSSQSRSPAEFVVSRIARLYPSFWVCAVLTTVAVNAASGGGGAPISWRTLGLNLTMIPGALGAPYVDGVYWTLFVELKFYFVILLVLVGGLMPRIELALGLWLAASVASALGVAPKAVSSLTLYPYGPYFISGCLFFLLRLHGPSVFRLGALAVACTLGALYAVAQQPDFMQNTTTASSIVVASVVILAHVMFAIIALTPKILPASRSWYWLGCLTYPLYLLHNRIGKAVAAEMPGSVSPWITIAIELVVAFAMSAAIASIVERRASRAFHKKLLSAAVRFRVVAPSEA